MKGELKAGGLALVIKSTDAHEVGRAVTLLRLISPGELFNAPDGTPCRWREYNPSSWLVTGQVQSNMPSGDTFYGWAVFPPTHLLPIDGDDDQQPQEREADEPREVVA